MKRMHLFEFEDFAWFPKVIRDLMTDYLGFVVARFKLYKPVVPLLKQVLNATGETVVVDLASGGGGPWPVLGPELKADYPALQVILTDLYPNLQAMKNVQAQAPEMIKIHDQPVNALEVPAQLRGLRTQFLSLHHFSPDQVAAIFANALQAKQAIAAFEFQNRSFAHAIQFACSPLFVLLLTPFIRPFSWKRLFFTYLMPVVPLFVMWDGVVSVLRTYKSEELRAMIDKLPHHNAFSWEIATKKEGQVTLNYVLGIPKSAPSA